MEAVRGKGGLATYPKNPLLPVLKLCPFPSLILQLHTFQVWVAKMSPSLSLTAHHAVGPKVMHPVRAKMAILHSPLQPQ